MLLGMSVADICKLFEHSLQCIILKFRILAEFVSIFALISTYVRTFLTVTVKL